MNIAIIGGGFTGLTAAYELTKRGHATAPTKNSSVATEQQSKYHSPYTAIIPSP